MIPIQGGDYETAGGERRYKGTDPATVVHEADMNQILLSMHRVVTQARDALLANPAAELADNWEQFSRCVQRLGWMAPPTTFTLISSGETLSPNVDIFAHIIAEGSSLPDGVVLIDSDPELEDHVLILYNSTATNKVIQNYDSSPVCCLPAGQAVIVHGVDESGDILWKPIGKPPDTGSFTVELRGSVAGLLDTQTARFRIESGVVEVYLPTMSFNLGGAQTLSITGASNGGWPAETDCLDSRKFPVCITNNNVESIGMAYFSGSAGSRVLNIQTGAGGTSFDGISGISGASIAYPAL